MSLSSFAAAHFEAIIQKWEARMRTSIATCRGLSQDELRDHLTVLLNAIIHNLDRDPQTRPDAALLEPRQGDIAHRHGEYRRAVGFDLHDVLVEYAALRATVLELWQGDTPPQSENDLKQVVRFNEAIDEAQSISVTRYLAAVQHDQTLLLATLGHDVRTPLMAITMAAYSLDSDADEQTIHAVKTQITKSSRRIDTMLKDLLDFTSTRLKGHLDIQPAPMDLRQLLHSQLAELKSAHPSVRIDCTMEGDLTGEWDESRLAQMLSNLALNAIQYRSPGTPVTIDAVADDDGIHLRIHNQGTPIPGSRLPDIFDALQRAAPKDERRTSRSGHLGIGLYIAQAIARAHGGHITVSSTEEQGTQFDAWLPRAATS